jgi:hypothetical protein
MVGSGTATRYPRRGMVTDRQRDSASSPSVIPPRAGNWHPSPVSSTMSVRIAWYPSVCRVLPRPRRALPSETIRHVCERAGKDRGPEQCRNDDHDDGKDQEAQPWAPLPHVEDPATEHSTRYDERDSVRQLVGTPGDDRSVEEHTENPQSQCFDDRAGSGAGRRAGVPQHVPHRQVAGEASRRCRRHLTFAEWAVQETRHREPQFVVTGDIRTCLPEQRRSPITHSWRGDSKEAGDIPYLRHCAVIDHSEGAGFTRGRLRLPSSFASCRHTASSNVLERWEPFRSIGATVRVRSESRSRTRSWSQLWRRATSRHCVPYCLPTSAAACGGCSSALTARTACESAHAPIADVGGQG